MIWTEWPKADEASLAQFVTPQAMQWLVLPASRYDLMHEADGRRQLVRVMYDALAHAGIRYDLESYHPSYALQYIRTPAEVLVSPRAGNCLDLAVLFAGLSLGNELLPLLVVLEGHALVLVSMQHGLRDWDSLTRRERSAFEDHPCKDIGLLRGLVADGSYLAVECTGVAQSNRLADGQDPESVGRIDGVLPFDRALAAGADQLNHSARPLIFTLDLAIARYAWRIEPRLLPSPSGGSRALEVYSEYGPGLEMFQYASNVTRRSPAKPYQLPPDIADFTSRDEQLEALEMELLGQSDVPPVGVISGKPGVGKSALAVRLAHKLKSHFGDGQLYVNLRGLEADRVSPTEVLSRFLRALGSEAEDIPDGLEERASLYRSSLASKRVLVLLDDAYDASQVRPVLPGSTECAVLITSRRRLASLATSDRAMVDLDVLEAHDGIRFLERMVGRDRVAAEAVEADHIVRLCGGLPLALRIAGARLRAKQRWSLGRLVQKLYDEHRRLSELVVDDLEVRACFALSYDDLPSDQARAFRLLSVLPGQHFGREAMAAVLDGSPAIGETILEQLEEIQLVETYSPPVSMDHLDEEHYKLHDLLRLFSKERLAQEETLADVAAATDRELKWYLSRALAMDEALQVGFKLELASPRKDPSGFETGFFSPRATLYMAQDWFELERTNLVAAVSQAADSGRWELVWRLAGAVSGFLSLYSYWDDWQGVNDRALNAWRELGNSYGEADILIGRAKFFVNQKRWDRALHFYEQVAAVWRRVGNTANEASAMFSLARAYADAKQWEEAISATQRSLEVWEKIDERESHAATLFNLGTFYLEAKRPDEAIRHLVQGLELSRQLDHKEEVATLLFRLGSAHSRIDGHEEKAIDYYKRSLSAYRELRDSSNVRIGEINLLDLFARLDRWDEAVGLFDKWTRMASEGKDREAEADLLLRLGYCHGARRSWREANACFGRSLELWRDLGSEWGIGNALFCRGVASILLGDSKSGTDALEQSLAVWNGLEDSDDTIPVRVALIEDALAHLSGLRNALKRSPRRFIPLYFVDSMKSSGRGWWLKDSL